MEPDGSLNITATPTLETDYTYDPLNNLTRVSQTGGSLVRSFSYDSLSRLITANNPESGLTCYGTWSGGAVGFLTEWETLFSKVTDPAEQSSLQAVKGLAEKSKQDVHQYLVFIGD